ncbi:MAG: heavy-metal-associated domain-containing protein [Gammaproteobacteria bacterium]
MNKITLSVEGMKCGGCESMVKSALESVAGVSTARADHQLKQVEVDFDSTQISAEQIKQIISGKGYTVKG